VVGQAVHITNDGISTTTKDAQNRGQVDVKPAEVYIQTSAIQPVEEVAKCRLVG